MILNIIGVEDMDVLSLGFVFLVIGGGGDLYLFMLFIKQVLEIFGLVRFIQVDDFDDDVNIVVLGVVGVFIVSFEFLFFIDEVSEIFIVFEIYI